MRTIEKNFKKYLKSRKLKFTPERKLIAECIDSFSGHFDVEGLYAKIHKRNHYLSVATIYRTFPHLISAGLIKEVLRCRNRPQYEKEFGFPHHDHLVCMRCGKILEFRDDRIEKLQNEVCRKYGFKSIEHRLGIRGYCKNCYSRIKGNAW